jgi:hypothetical protein
MLLCKFTEGFRRINIPNNTRASSIPPFPPPSYLIHICVIDVRNMALCPFIYNYYYNSIICDPFIYYSVIGDPFIWDWNPIYAYGHPLINFDFIMLN